jgi:hypothetical protein
MYVYRRFGTITPIDNRESVLEEPQVVVDRLRLLYEQGVPFFTIRTFWEIVRQLDHCRANPRPPPCPQRCPKAYRDEFDATSSEEDSDADEDPGWPVISIPTLDGNAVGTWLRTGLVRPGDKKNTEFVLYVHPRLNSNGLSE